MDIFEKDFLIVPINKNAHWYLAIICYPYLSDPQYATATANIEKEEPIVASEDTKSATSTTKQQPSVSLSRSRRAEDALSVTTRNNASVIKKSTFYGNGSGVRLTRTQVAVSLMAGLNANDDDDSNSNDEAGSAAAPADVDTSITDEDNNNNDADKNTAPCVKM